MSNFENNSKYQPLTRTQIQKVLYVKQQNLLEPALIVENAEARQQNTSTLKYIKCSNYFLHFKNLITFYYGKH